LALVCCNPTKTSQSEAIHQNLLKENEIANFSPKFLLSEEILYIEG